MVAIPDFKMKELVSKNAMRIEGLDKDLDIQPASIDLGPLKGDYYITEAYSNKISDRYLKGSATSHMGEFNSDTIFEVDKTYILKGPWITIPESLEGHIEQKSTTGRLGAFNELLLPDGKDKLNRTNYIPAGYNGPTYFRIENRAFRIQFKPSDKIAQLRLTKKGTGFLSHKELDMLYGRWFGHYPYMQKEILAEEDKLQDFERKQLLSKDDVLDAGTTIMRADTQLVFEQKKGVTRPIVYSKKEDANIEDYWKIIINNESELRIPYKTLFLTSSADVVKTGPDVCWKMGMKTEGLGVHVETHRAGFGDPGFYARVTAEIINHHKDLIIENGQYLSHLLWEPMEATPEVIYGDKKKGGHYQGQIGPIPPKQFRGFSTVWEDVQNGKVKAEPRKVDNIEEFFKNLRKVYV